MMQTTPRGPTSPEEWWPYYAARPWLSGGFAWTGFDYRGEPTPYRWPWRQLGHRRFLRVTPARLLICARRGVSPLCGNAFPIGIGRAKISMLIPLKPGKRRTIVQRAEPRLQKSRAAPSPGVEGQVRPWLRRSARHKRFQSCARRKARNHRVPSEDPPHGRSRGARRRWRRSGDGARGNRR